MSKNLIVAYFVLGTLLIAVAVTFAILAALTPAYSLYIPALIILLFGGGLVLKPAEIGRTERPKTFIEKNLE